MPDAKSLLPGRAFRSEHAQLRPEPHSIASHGPAPMDPLQTTRMRNGVLYAAEWPCCHDPLRLSLGSEDPFQHTHTRGAAPRASPLSREGGVRWLWRCARLPRVRGGAPHSHACSRVGCRCKQTQKPKHLAPARRSFGQRPRRAACASRAWEASSGCADDQSGHRHRRGRLAVEGEGGLAPPVAPRTLLHKRLAGGPHWPHTTHTHSSLPHHSASHRHQNCQCRTKNIVCPSPYYALGSLASAN